MTKTVTKIWLHGFKRLMSNLPAVQPDSLRGAAKKPRAAPGPDNRRRRIRDVVDSRVRPRPAAWAKGRWLRSYYSAPPLPGRLVNHLSYGLYVPPAKSTRKAPLVVMLHGCKQTIDDFAAGTRMNLLADRHGFAVVYPEQSRHVHAHRCWHWYDDRDTAGRGEARAIVSLVEALVDEYGFDAQRIYVVGLSAGGGLACLLALHWPERFAAVALHSAPAFGEAHSGMTAMDVMRRGARHDPISLVDAAVDVATYPGMPAIIVHGDADRVVAPRNADQLAIEFLRLNRLVNDSDATLGSSVCQAREAGASVSEYSSGGRCVVRLCHVPDLGHAWAGGDEAIAFHSHKGPDASALIWDFFRAQRRSIADAAPSPALASNTTLGR